MQTCDVITLAIPAATIVEADLGSGDDVLVTAFGRDQRDAQVAAKAWHRLMYREPGTTVLGSRLQHVEHVADVGRVLGGGSHR